MLNWRISLIKFRDFGLVGPPCLNWLRLALLRVVVIFRLGYRFIFLTGVAENTVQA